MAPTDYVSDWEDLYGRKLPKDGSIRPAGEDQVETVTAKVVEAPKAEKPAKNSKAEVK